MGVPVAELTDKLMQSLCWLKQLLLNPRIRCYAVLSPAFAGVWSVDTAIVSPHPWTPVRTACLIARLVNSTYLLRSRSVQNSLNSKPPVGKSPDAFDGGRCVHRAHAACNA